MIERIDDMPAGTLGFRASGEVSADDYRQVLEPPLREAAEAGEVRLLYEIDAPFEMEAGAMAQDTKVGLQLGLGHLAAWKRTAIVTDVEWVAKSVRLFAWMVLGELRVVGLEELDEAREWVAG